MCGTLESQFQKLSEITQKKRQSTGKLMQLRQLLIIFGGVALVQLAMRN